MKLRISAIWLVVLVTLQGSVTAQEWSSWTTAHSNWTTLFNNKDVQYRWLTSTSSGSQECQLQLRDLKRQPTQATVVSVHIDYQTRRIRATCCPLTYFAYLQAVRHFGRAGSRLCRYEAFLAP